MTTAKPRSTRSKASAAKATDAPTVDASATVEATAPAPVEATAPVEAPAPVDVAVPAAAAPTVEALLPTVPPTPAYEQVMKMTKDYTKSFDDLSTFSKDGLEAAMQAGQIWTKGVEELNKTMVEYAKASFEANMAAGKAMLGAKSLRELTDLQNDHAKATLDTMMAESTKISELSIKCANDAIEPLSKQFNVVLEKVMKPIAA